MAEQALLEGSSNSRCCTEPSGVACKKPETVDTAVWESKSQCNKAYQSFVCTDGQIAGMTTSSLAMQEQHSYGAGSYQYGILDSLVNRCCTPVLEQELVSTLAKSYHKAEPSGVL